jgi:photosystem I subunit 11
MANFIKPYNDDPFVGHLATPITSSAVTRAILQNLPAYRSGLTPLLRGLEVGLAHGYFLMGPFVKLGPLRDSDIALFAGFINNWFNYHSNFSSNYLWCSIFGQEKSESSNENDLQTKSLGSIQRWILLVHAEVDLHLFVCLFRPLQQAKYVLD